MAAVMPTKMMDPAINVFTPPDAGQAIQTPYGSLQLASSAFQQQALSLLGQSSTSALMGGGMPGVESEDEEEEEEEDDDEDGTKGKRKRSKSGVVGGKGGKKGAAGGSKGAISSGMTQAAGDRDIHTGRRKIRIEFIEDDSRRHITFSKRKAGIMKKAYELATLTGTQVLLLIVSQTGLVYTFTTPKLSPVVQQSAGRELIQSCLNAPEPGDNNNNNNNNNANTHTSNAPDESHEGEDSRNESQQDELAIGDYASNFAPHLPQNLHHPGNNNDLFHDPRNVMGQPSHMSNLNINMAHLQGLSYGGYPGHQMGIPDQAIQYGSYGL